MIIVALKIIVIKITLLTTVVINNDSNNIMNSDIDNDDNVDSKQ